MLVFMFFCGLFIYNNTYSLGFHFIIYTKLSLTRCPLIKYHKSLHQNSYRINQSHITSTNLISHQQISYHINQSHITSTNLISHQQISPNLHGSQDMFKVCNRQCLEMAFDGIYLLHFRQSPI